MGTENIQDQPPFCVGFACFRELAGVGEWVEDVVDGRGLYAASIGSVKAVGRGAVEALRGKEKKVTFVKVGKGSLVLKHRPAET